MAPSPLPLPPTISSPTRLGAPAVVQSAVALSSLCSGRSQLVVFVYRSSLMMKPAKQCCCGCTLLTGVKIIAVLYLIVSINFVLGYLAEEKEKVQEDTHEKIDGIHGEYYESFKTHKKSRDLTGFVYTLVLTCLLWIGIYTNDRQYFVIFVIMKLIALSLAGVVILIFFAIAIFNLSSYLFIIGLMMVLFVIPVPGYITWIVWSHAERLKTVEERSTPIRTI